VVEEAIGQKLPIPESVAPLFAKEKKSILLEADYEVFKGWMLKNNLKVDFIFVWGSPRASPKGLLGVV
jgi:hypothetical protein